jgi:hypothetical protein
LAKITKEKRLILYSSLKLIPQRLRLGGSLLAGCVSGVQQALARQAHWSEAMRTRLQRCAERRLALALPWYAFCQQKVWCPFCYVRQLILPQLERLEREWVAPSVWPAASLVLGRLWSQPITADAPASWSVTSTDSLRLRRLGSGRLWSLPAFDPQRGIWRWQERFVFWWQPRKRAFPLLTPDTDAQWRCWSAASWQLLPVAERWRLLTRWLWLYPVEWLLRPDGGWWVGQLPARQHLVRRFGTPLVAEKADDLA